MKSFPLPVPSRWCRISGKEVEVHDSGSRHHQLCGCCNLQLIQSHEAPSHSPPARVLSPLFFPEKFLLLPKPHGKKKHSKTTWSSLLSFRTAWSFSPLQNHMDLYLLASEPRGSLLPSELHGLRPIYFGAAWSLLSPPKPCGPHYSPSEPCSSLPFYLLQNLMVPPIHSRTVWPPIYFRTAWSSLSMAAGPRFKSQRPSSFAAPLLTPPTVSYTCQHPRILPALLSCHSKSGQVWPHGMEPIISKLSRRPCNQGKLLPSPILGGIRSHPPGSKHGHSYLTYL